MFEKFLEKLLSFFRGRGKKQRTTTEQTEVEFKITPELVARIDEAAARGFSRGVGDRDGQMCVEAAICYALGEPHGDQPSCVEPVVRNFKIALNDSPYWRSEHSRAEGLRDIAIAQLGSRGVVNGEEFIKRMGEKTIRTLIPALFRELFTDTSDPKHQACLEAADRCEREASRPAARAAAYAAYGVARNAAAGAARNAVYGAAHNAADAAARDAADTANWAAYATYATDASARAAACGASNEWTEDPEKYLRMSAALALETLRELGSPGCEWV